MATVVTLDVYSGRPNPSWVLSDADSQKLTERVHAIDTVTSQKSSGALGGLGYRGFLVNHTPHSVQAHPAFHVHEGIIDKGLSEDNLVSRDRELEDWLLSTAKGAVHDDVKTLVSGELRI